MKRVGSTILISCLISSLALLGCETSSRLDKTVQNKAADKPPEAAPAKSDHSGSVEDRLARLEDAYAKSAEAIDWLGKVYEQQKQQQKQQAREEADPDAVFAVDISPNVKLGLVEGPAGAPITIVEAWDFA